MSLTGKITSPQQPFFSATDEKVRNGHKIWSDKGTLMINHSIVFWLCSIHNAAVSINKLSMLLVRFVTFTFFDLKHYSSCLCILSLCFFIYDWINIFENSNQESSTINMLYSLKRICHIAPPPPCNGHLSTAHPFFCSQGGHA